MDNKLNTIQDKLQTIDGKLAVVDEQQKAILVKLVSPSSSDRPKNQRIILL